MTSIRRRVNLQNFANRLDHKGIPMLIDELPYDLMRQSSSAQIAPYSPRCFSTIRTARSRISGENLFDLFMAPFSQRLEPPQNPGRFSVASLSIWLARITTAIGVVMQPLDFVGYDSPSNEASLYGPTK